MDSHFSSLGAVGLSILFPSNAFLGEYGDESRNGNNGDYAYVS